MRILQILLCVLVALSSGDARAERTAILIAGNAPQHERDVSLSAMAASVTAQGGDVVKASFSTKETTQVQQCLKNATPWTCMKPTVAPKGIEQLVIGSVDTGTSLSGTPTIQLTGYLVVASLSYAIADKRHCDPCTDDLLTNLAGELAEAQLRRLAILRGRTLVSIETTPRGARITFDGDVQGTSDAVVPTYPGEHTVRLELDGHDVETRTITAVEYKTAEVHMMLRPNGKPTGDRPTVPPPRPSRLVPVLVGSIGLAAVITGGVLIAVHDPPDADPKATQDEFYYRTRTPGIVMAVGGALAIGASVYLWRRQSRSAVVAAPLTGGAAIGWITSF